MIQQTQHPAPYIRNPYKVDLVLAGADEDCWEFTDVFDCMGAYIVKNTEYMVNDTDFTVNTTEYIVTYTKYMLFKSECIVNDTEGIFNQTEQTSTRKHVDLAEASSPGVGLP